MTTDLIVVDVRTAVLVRVEEGVQLALQAGVIQSLGDEMPSGACLNVGHSRIEMQQRRAVEQLLLPRRLDAAGRIALSVSAQAPPDHVAHARMSAPLADQGALRCTQCSCKSGGSRQAHRRHDSQRVVVACMVGAICCRAVAPVVTLACRPSRAICVAHRDGTRHSLKAELGADHCSIVARGAVPRLKLSLWRLDIDLQRLCRVHAGLGEDARFRSSE